MYGQRRHNILCRRFHQRGGPEQAPDGGTSGATDPDDGYQGLAQGAGSIMKSAVQLENTRGATIGFQEASIDIWDKKYRLKSKAGEVVDETMDDTYQRVARALADVTTTSAAAAAPAAPAPAPSR